MTLNVERLLAASTDEQIDYDLFDVVTDEEPHALFDADNTWPPEAGLTRPKRVMPQRGMTRALRSKFGNRTGC